jgi:isopentenyl diphosphate isomerase/L-lactate dehydrogenase-like FMN-dependent dehydrogenase
VLGLLCFSAAGYKAIFLTVDCPIVGIRHNEYRNDFGIPEGFAYPNLSSDTSKPYGLGEDNPDIEYGTQSVFAHHGTEYLTTTQKATSPGAKQSSGCAR